jgi:hypothetical protein
VGRKDRFEEPGEDRQQEPGVAGANRGKIGRVPTRNVTPSCDPVRCIHYSATPTSVNGVVPRSDIVDLSAGIKLHPTSSAYLYLAAIVPLTQQGFRTAVIPAGGFEWTF